MADDGGCWGRGIDVGAMMFCVVALKSTSIDRFDDAAVSYRSSLFSFSSKQKYRKENVSHFESLMNENSANPNEIENRAHIL